MLRSPGMGAAAAIAGIVVAAVFLLWIGQRRLIYMPSVGGAVPSARQVGLASAVDVQLPTEDGLTLGAWFVPASAGGSGWTLILFNGNAGHRAFRAPLASRLADAGVSVLMCDYRGFGGNPGQPTEEGLARDARAALGWVRGRGGAAPGPIAYFGESLGAAVAVRLAVESQPAALILRSPFTSMVDVARHHYPWLPVGWLLADRYPSIDRIGRLTCPVLVIAGDRDSVVPSSQSRRLYEAALESQRHWLLVPGADHNDFELLAGDALVDAVLRLLRNQQR
jgi:fermentation-respiration switch protein FrsA (DUF1100 family)